MSKLHCLLFICAATFTWLNPSAEAQITVNRTDYGFNDSRFYFTGATHAADSIDVGAPNADSAQVFDFRSVYFDQSYSAQWSEDTVPLFSGANEIQIDLSSSPNMGNGVDTTPTFYSTSNGSGFDSLLYYGFGNPAFTESAALEHPIPLFIFPMTLGSQWSGTAIGSLAQNNATISVNAKVDAYGTLRIPSGDFPALRVFVRLDFATPGLEDFVEYRYYYITSSPYTSACFVAYYTSDSSSHRQLVQSGSYTGPTPKYNHMVAPVLSFSYQGTGIYHAMVGIADTLHFELHNIGDTTGLIDSVYLYQSTSLFSLTNNLCDSELSAGDSEDIPLIFMSSIPDTAKVVLSVAYSDLSEGIGITIISTPSSNVNTVPITESDLSVFPNPAKDFISTSSTEDNLLILDQLGRSYTVYRIENTFDISSLPPGIYFISDGVSKAKFVKE
jgi:hypothetical protein